MTMIHNIDPVLFQIGWLSVRWYPLAYIIGIVLGILYIKLLAKRSKLNVTTQFFDSLFTMGVLGIVIGGRLGYVVLYAPISYLENPIEILKTWHGGMSFHGGMIGLIIAIVLVCRHYKTDLWKVLDLVACAAPIGIFFGRIANFINGELFGRITDASWGVVFANTGGGPYARHPSQLYEALTEGLLLFVIMLVLLLRYKLYKRPMVLSGVFGVFYAIFRFGIEFFREPDVQIGYILGCVTMGQILSIIMVAIGSVLIARGVGK